jgi:hypothetical protein
MLPWLWRHAYPTMDMHMQDGGMYNILFEMNGRPYIFYTKNDIENM